MLPHVGPRESPHVIIGKLLEAVPDNAVICSWFFIGLHVYTMVVSNDPSASMVHASRAWRGINTILIGGCFLRFLESLLHRGRCGAGATPPSCLAKNRLARFMTYIIADARWVLCCFIACSFPSFFTSFFTYI